MSRLNTIIDANIKENGNQEITGKALNYVLNEIAKEVEQGGNVKADGVYPDLIAGDLAGRGESVPAEFTFRASGGKSIKDGKAYIKRIKGNSVVWNQKIDKVYVDRDRSLNTREGESMISGHKYLLNRSVAKKDCYVIVADDFYDYSIYEGQYSKIFTNAYDCVSDGVYPSRPHIYCTGESGYVQLIDLTLMFGAGNEPSTIEEYEARKPIVEDEYAYNEGEVIPFTAESIKSVGDNAWDEQWENGYFNTDNGNNGAASGYIRSKNRISVISGEYYVSMPSNVGDFQVVGYDHDGNIIPGTINGASTFVISPNIGSIRFYCNYGSDTYNGGILISLKHSGWKQDTDAGYQPYWEDMLPLPIIRKYFPDGMKSAGNAHDEIRFNKTTKKWEKVQRIGSVDLGTLDWWHNNEGRMIAALAYGVFNKVLDNEPANAICAQYPIKKYVHVYTNNYGLALSYQEPYLYVTVFDSAYTDAATFKAAMQGVILYYELAEPIVTEITDSFRDYYNVADFGTEQAISNILSAPFSADIIYQFNAVDMIRENYNEIERIKAALAKVGITLD